MNTRTDTMSIVDRANAVRTAVLGLEQPVCRLMTLVKVQNALLEGVFPNAEQTSVAERDNTALCFVGQEIEKACRALEADYYSAHRLTSFDKEV